MLRARRPQGTARSTLTGTVGQGRSRFETARDGLRPLEATAHNATRARLRFGTSPAAPKRTTEGPGNQHRRPCERLPRHERSQPGHRDIDALGTISSALDGLVSRPARTDPPAPTGHRHHRSPSRSTPERHARLQVSMTAGPPSRPPTGDRPQGPSLAAAPTGSRLHVNFGAARKRRHRSRRTP